jgi:hypothetical protein
MFFNNCPKIFSFQYSSCGAVSADFIGICHLTERKPTNPVQFERRSEMNSWQKFVIWEDEHRGRMAFLIIVAIAVIGCVISVAWLHIPLIAESIPVLVLIIAIGAVISIVFNIITAKLVNRNVVRLNRHDVILVVAGDGHLRTATDPFWHLSNQEIFYMDVLQHDYSNDFFVEVIGPESVIKVTIAVKSRLFEWKTRGPAYSAQELYKIRKMGFTSVHEYLHQQIQDIIHSETVIQAVEGHLQNPFAIAEAIKTAFTTYAISQMLECMEDIRFKVESVKYVFRKDISVVHKYPTGEFANDIFTAPPQSEE